MSLNPWRRIRELEEHVAALAKERAQGWQQISALEEKLDKIKRASSERVRKGNETRKANIIAKAAELRRETARQQEVF